MRPKAVATFSATPSWGQSWRAISKVRAWRVSRLGEDLERLEAISVILFLSPGAAGPSPARSPRCGTKKPGPGGLHPKGRSACGGRRRAANLPREEFGFGRRGNSSTMSRCRPNGLGLGPRITEGNELAMGSSCGPLLAREKGSPKWLARLTRDVPPAIRTCFCRPILMALLFCPLSRGRMNRGKCRLAGNWFIVDDNDVGCSARSSCPHADGRRWPPNFFPQRQGGRCALR